MKLLVCILTLSIPLLAQSRSYDSSAVVVVELFTSEGCSSCPPADEALARLDKSGASGARVIALEEHVDYWNNLGWSDPFSSALYRARQMEYARVFRTENIYTPQMVIDGMVGFPGDDVTEAQHQISRLSSTHRYLLRLEPHPISRTRSVVELAIHLKPTSGQNPQPSNVYLAVTESSLASRVSAGENSGRVLHHAPVVRSFGVIATLDTRPFREAALHSTLQIPDSWKRENLRAVVFIQDAVSLQITGASAVALP